MAEFSGRSIYVAVAITVGAAAAAGAQTCVGNAPFSAGPVRLSADFAFPNNAKSFGGTAAFGTATPGLFARVAGSALRYDQSDGTRKTFDVGAGFSVPVKAGSAIEVCPLADISHSSGPNTSLFSSSSTTVGLGGSVGRAVVATPTLNVVPFADLRWLFSQGTSEFNGDKSSGSDHAGVLTVGAGFVFSKKLTLRPGIEIPVRDADLSTFAISLGYSLGGKK